MRRWLPRPDYCPDRKCRPLAKVSMVDGGCCVGLLHRPTDHVIPAVNDKSFCYRQYGKRHQWHFNSDDVLVLLGMVAEAFKAQGHTLPEQVINNLPKSS